MFEKNLIQYTLNKEVGTCPKCGSVLKVEALKTSDRDNCQISCGRCSKSEFFVGSLRK